MKRPHGHPILGAFAGFFFGLFVALDLLLFGAIQLDSILLTLLPLIGLIVVPLVAWFAPIGARQAAAGAGPSDISAPTPVVTSAPAAPATDTPGAPVDEPIVAERADAEAD